MRSKPARSARERGFTLIEIMVVIVILGVLAALVVPKVMSRPDEARVVAAQQDINAIMSALKLYRLDNTRYPDTTQGLRALVSQPEGVESWKPGGYLERLPNDPWGNAYQYAKLSADHVRIWSKGPDGGESDAKSNDDISSDRP